MLVLINYVLFLMFFFLIKLGWFVVEINKLVDLMFLILVFLLYVEIMVFNFLSKNVVGLLIK